MRRLGLTLIAVAACHSRTELMIGVATDIRAPNLIDEVDLDVSDTSNGVSQVSAQWSLSGVPDVPDNLPGSYGVFSSDGSEPQITILLTGLKNGSPVVTRRSIVSLISDQTLFYRVGLTAGCQTMQDCGSPDMTCIEGQCKDAHLDSHLFPSFSDDLVTTLTCNSGITYIETATGDPMELSADAADCPTSQCSEGTCLTPPQNPQGCPPPSTLVDGFCACPNGTIPDSNNPSNQCDRNGCTSSIECSHGFTCNTATMMCVMGSGTGGGDAGVPPADGGA